MKNALKFLFILSILTLTISCDDEQTIQKPIDVIKGNWKLVNEKIIGKLGDTISSISNYDKCAIDDIYSFQENENLVVTDAGLTCANGPGAFEYRYIINEKANEKNTFTLGIGGSSGHKVIGIGMGGDIISFDQNSFVIRDLIGCGDSAMPFWCYRLKEFRKNK
jgi:hypothetical protein